MTLFLGACEELAQRFIQEIGPERLSLERLEREVAERVADGDLSWNLYAHYGFRTVADLRQVVEAFDMPAGVRTNGDHLFDGEECVLLMLRRFRSADPLLSLTWETGRSVAAISEAVLWTVEHITTEFPHLLDERSFHAWAGRFDDFAQAFEKKGVPLNNLIGFIDGKLYPTCKPVRCAARTP